MQKHNKIITSITLAVLILALASSPVTSLGQRQTRVKLKKVAVLRQQTQSAMLPTAQEVDDFEKGRSGRARRVLDFKVGRDVLTEKGVKFEPYILLEQNWRERLRDVLAQAPEFQEVRREGKKLKGAQLADTLYLPEKIEIEGDTVIVAKRLIFEGKNVVMKGNHDVHIFTVEPPMLTQQVARSGQAQFLKAGFMSTSESSRLAATMRVVQNGHITIDTSGTGRKEWLESRRKNKKAALRLSEARIMNASLSSSSPQHTEDTSGQRGADGYNGNPGDPGTNGDNGANGANGVCGSNVNGTEGGAAEYGGTGKTGKNGTSAVEPGTNAHNITINAQIGYTYTLIANGGDGGKGGDGGMGGTGGGAGTGGRGGNGADCPCNQGASGEGGRGGDAGGRGRGGDGGDGGDGSDGGDAGTITVNHPSGFDINSVTAIINVGKAGGRGAGGDGGSPGYAGTPGKGGSGASGISCSGTAGRNGTNGNPPLFGGSYGVQGKEGSPGENGATGGITYNITSSGGGGGGGGGGGYFPPYRPCTHYYWYFYESWDGINWFESDQPVYAGCW